jgi:hypothetical protein
MIYRPGHKPVKVTDEVRLIDLPKKLEEAL